VSCVTASDPLIILIMQLQRSHSTSRRAGGRSFPKAYKICSRIREDRGCTYCEEVVTTYLIIRPPTGNEYHQWQNSASNVEGHFHAIKEGGHFVGEELINKVVREHESCFISTP
jgi:hypothetical protein